MSKLKGVDGTGYILNNGSHVTFAEYKEMRAKKLQSKSILPQVVNEPEEDNKIVSVIKKTVRKRKSKKKEV